MIILTQTGIKRCSSVQSKEWSNTKQLVISSDIMQRNYGRRRCWVGCCWVRVSVVFGECWGMGCLYNEARRGLCLTMEAKGVRSGLNCVRREDEACGAWRCYSRLCALVRSRYSRGGGSSEGREADFFFKRRTKTSISSWLPSTRRAELEPPDTCRANIRYLVLYRNR